MNDSELHPVLRDALAQPGNPNATPVEKQSPDVARTEFEADIAAVDGPPPEVASVDELLLHGAAGELPARLYRPASASGTDMPLMIYFHGGGNIRGSIRTHDSTARVLANACGFPVLSCSYRLAPEHPYPAALDDATAINAHVRELAPEWGISTDRIVVAGDSAGGNLAAALAQRMRNENGPRFAVQLLVYPVIDHTAQTQSRTDFSRGYMLDSMPFYTRCYLPDHTRRSDPYASPGQEPDLAGLPPTVILTAGFDPLRDEALAYADSLADSGVKVSRLHYPDMIHGFTLLRGLLPEADAALAACAARVVEFLKN